MPYNQNFESQSRTLQSILDQILRACNFGLPAFQRELVWDRAKKLELFISVLNGDPIGSILLVDVDDEKVASYQPRNFESAPELKEGEDLVLVVDGQQRLSAILDIVESKVRMRKGLDKTLGLEINVRGILGSNNSDLEDHFRWVSSQDPTVEDQAKKGIMRATLLNDSTLRQSWFGKFQEFEELSDADFKAIMETLPPGIVKGIGDYQIPAITLTKSNSLSQVLDYFEKLNTKGEPLVAFDIAHSRMSNQGPTPPGNYDLRSTVTDALEGSKKLIKLGIKPSRADDQMLALQLLAVRLMPPNLGLGGIGQDVTDIGTGSILSIPAEAIRGSSADENFTVEFAVEMLEKSAAFLHDECGVVSPKLLPQKSMLIPIADQMWSQEKEEAFVPQVDLRRWFYCLCLQGEFHGRTKSSAVFHSRELHRWARERSSVPDVISHTNIATIRKIDFSDQFKDQPKIQITAALAMMVKEGAEDWSDSGIKVSNLDSVDLHHICPSAKLAQFDIKRSERLSAANLTPIGAGTNKSIGDQEPSEVFPDADWSEQSRAELLEKHLVSPDVFTGNWGIRKYNKLLKTRGAAMRDLVINVLSLEA